MAKSGERKKILAMFLLLACCCVLTYYFHAVLGTSTVFTHFFYIPIVLAAVWWRRKGVMVAVFLAVLIFISHNLFRTDVQSINDYCRALVFVIVSLAVVGLRIRIDRAEEELFEREQWLATTLRSIGDAVIATDAKGIVSFMNHVAEGLTGWDGAKAVGKPLKDVFNIINEQTGESAENPVARVIREGIVVGLANHTVLISKDGTKLPIADSGAPMKDEEGNIIGVVLVFRDITEHKRAEKVLKRERNNLRSIFESMEDGVFIVSQQNDIQYVNSVLAKDFGPYEGRKCYKYFHDRKEVCPWCRNQEIWAGKTVQWEWYSKKNDKTYDMIDTPIKNPDGSISKLEILRDITERKQAEGERDRLQSQLVQSEKMAGIGMLTSGIAHEFNNLLQIMSGHAEFAQRTKKPEDMEEALDIVGNTSDRVSKIIKDLLTFSRREPSERKLCSIAELVEFVLSMIEEQLIKSNINVGREFRKVPKVDVNDGEIQQVFLNMVTNARDAMLPEGGKLEIGIKKVKDDVEISFTDTGIGIEEENLGRVFEPFYTTKGPVGGNIRTQGIGLGLSVSYGIVERHGGTIEVESEVGKGTTFTIKLPLEKQGRRDKKIEAEEKVEKAKPKSLDILVVDDEPDICSMLTKWLSADGHKVKSVSVGSKAINLVKKKHYDVVFLDIVMPGIPGDEVLVKIKEISSKIKVIMITGSLMKKSSWRELKQKGASGYIKKPFKMKDIKKFL
jgi:PAS domain S-box-containing protein